MRSECFLAAAAAICVGVPLAFMAPGALPRYDIDQPQAPAIEKSTTPCATKSQLMLKKAVNKVTLTCS